MHLLLGGDSQTELLGLSPAKTVVIETDPTLRWRHCFARAVKARLEAFSIYPPSTSGSVPGHQGASPGSGATELRTQ